MTDWPASAPLATVAELEPILNTRRAGQEADLLELLLDAASESVERHRSRLFHSWPAMPVPTEEQPTPELPAPVTWRTAIAGRRMIRVPDARELTAVRVDGATISSELDAAGGNAASWWGWSGTPAPLCTNGGYRLYARPGHPAHAILIPTYGARVLELEGYFGFHPTPPDVRLAVLEWAARAYHERNARMADSVADPEGGAWSYFRQIPAGIAATLDRYWIPGL